MPCALLYNITDGEKLQTLRLIFFQLRIQVKTVSPEEYGKPIGALCSLEGAYPAEMPDAGDFTDEMLVLCGLSSNTLDALLSMLRTKHVPIALKAVVTEENARWSSLRLHEELAREHEAMRALRRDRLHPKKRRK